MEPAADLDPLTRTALRSLHDIVLPEPVSWMPQTWGWAVVAAITAAVLLACALRALAHYRRNAYRRQAQALLTDIEQRIRTRSARQDVLCEVAAILKRVAIASWGRKAVASLSGPAWLQLFDEHSASAAGPALRSVLEDFEYRGPSVLNRLPPSIRLDIVAAARLWVREHHV